MSDIDRNDDLDDLGGDAAAAAERPMSADPGVRDASATGGGGSPGQGGGSTGGLAAGGGLGGPAAGAAVGDAREGGGGIGQTAADQAGTGAAAIDQRPADTLGRDADTLERSVDRPDSELGRLGPGGSGVGNTVMPQESSADTNPGSSHDR